MLFYFDPSLVPEPLSPMCMETKKDKGKEKIVEGGLSPKLLGNSLDGDVPLILFLKLLNRPLFLRSNAHLEQVGLISWSSDFKHLSLQFYPFEYIYIYIYSLFHSLFINLSIVTWSPSSFDFI